MNVLLWSVYFFGAFLLQAVASPLLAPLNMTVLLVGLFGRAAAHVYTDQHGFASYRAEYAASLFGMGCGLVEDLLGGGLLGPGMLTKGAIGLLSAVIFSDVLFRWTPVFGGITMIAFTVLDWFGETGALAVFGSLPVVFSATVLPLLFQCIVNGIAGMVIRPGRFGIA
jgi:hypothetical protein